MGRRAYGLDIRSATRLTRFPDVSVNLTLRPSDRGNIRAVPGRVLLARTTSSSYTDAPSRDGQTTPAGRAGSWNAWLTGALASNGLHKPSSLPISRTAGSTSSPISRMHLRVSSFFTNPSLPQKPTMDGRVSSSRRRILGTTVFGVPATICWSRIWSSNAAPRGFGRRPTAYSTNALRYDGEKYPDGLDHTGCARPVNSPCIHMNCRAFCNAFSSVSATWQRWR